MITIVGGGPAGSLSAMNASAKDEVTIYEEHLKQPVQCAGLVSKSGLERLGIKLKKTLIRNRISGAKLISPLGSEIEIKARRRKALVIDRDRFDKFLLNMAVDSGAEFVNKRVENLREIEGERIILATGTDYTLHRRAGLSIPSEFLIGAQYELDVECDRDLVELHFNVPEFFSWIIPMDDYARVGVCRKENPIPFLDRFVRRLEAEDRIHGSVRKKNYGIIPVYEPGIRTQYDNIILLGDAAGQVKATSGGGVVMAGLAAKHCMKGNYEDSWRQDIGKELSLHLKIHRFLEKLSPKNKDKLFSLVRQYKDSLEKEGDMDLASKSLASMLRNPSFVIRFILNSPRFLIDMI